ncbi:hypothetical protein [Vibrio sp. EA2]|uniref:hypothetical protein n=1 Tax=Vibrio sp. EA2 TaxID=3079860 RepID=UPI002949D8BD|nr:hypothetical protein [Vibrio sp. EA2]MDV6250064.1 hypothetical protein [Vibrio sp. EA2]
MRQFILLLAITVLFAAPAFTQISSAYAMMYTLKRSYVDGMDRVCIYTLGSSQRQLYVGAVQLCPISHEF